MAEEEPRQTPAPLSEVGHTLPVEPPDTLYALTEGLHIAYQSFGTGPPVVMVSPLVSNVELSWDHELYRRVLEYDAQHLHIVMFDKRGIGCSDRFDRAPTIEERISDITAVMNAEGIERATLVGLSEGGIMAQFFAARFPDRVEKLVLLNTTPGVGAGPDLLGYAEPGDPPFDWEYWFGQWQRFVQAWGTDPAFLVDWMMPSQRDNVSFIRWIGRLERQTASPADIERQITSVFSLDATSVLADISAPTLVMHVKGDRVINVASGRILADRIPGATFVEIEGDDHFLWVMPHWRTFLDPMFEFILGHSPSTTTTRRFGAVLFTDLVESTARSARTGDGAWRGILESHDRICREVVDGYAGRMVKNTGDGLLAVFDAPSLAVGAATDLVTKLSAIDLGVRAGIHAGEMEVRDDGDISGTTVNIAARVEQAAGLGEVYVSSTVRDMLLGGEHRFEERGEHALKGVEGTWKLFAVAR